MATIGQERSSFALEKVMGVKVSDKSGFASFTAGAAIMILQNGLGQAVAFWRQKSDGKNTNKHGALLEIVRLWLDRKGLVESSDDRTFIAELGKVSQQSYLAAQKEALALIEWVKRYANAGLWEG